MVLKPEVCGFDTNQTFYGLMHPIFERCLKIMILCTDEGIPFGNYERAFTPGWHHIYMTKDWRTFPQSFLSFLIVVKLFISRQ